MKHELSIFIDESGDFGKYQKYCPFYLVTFVLHDQQLDIKNNARTFNEVISYLNLPDKYIHSGPIIRQENEYYNMNIKDRRKALSIGINFIRKCPIEYHTFIINREIANDEMNITVELSKKIKEFINNNYLSFNKYKRVKVYYDNGQKQLVKILASVLPISIPVEVKFKSINPAENYCLFQVADIICSLELINLKIERGLFSKSERIFFKTSHQFMHDFYKKIAIKRIN